MVREVYSWSCLNSYYMAEQGEGCFYDWWESYLNHNRSGGNFFSEYGSLFHDTMEKLLRGELEYKNVKRFIENGLASLEHRAPFYNMGKSYEKQLYNFFELEYLNLVEKIHPLEMEKLKHIEVRGYTLKGYPDLICNHDDYGFVVADYKTSKVYTGEKLKHNILQLVLYGKKIEEEYKCKLDGYLYIFPRCIDNLTLFTPRSEELIMDMENFVEETIKKIESHKGEWTARCEAEGFDKEKDFFCNHLCGRKDCKYFNDTYDPFEDPFVEEENPFAD